MEIKTCNKCSAPIFWAKSKNNKWMAMDEDPKVDGDCWLDLGDGIPIAHKAYPNSPEGDRYNCHFGTCPGMSASQPSSEKKADVPPSTDDLPF